MPHATVHHAHEAPVLGEISLIGPALIESNFFDEERTLYEDELAKYVNQQQRFEECDV
jgi:hypothetical protein